MYCKVFNKRLFAPGAAEILKHTNENHSQYLNLILSHQVRPQRMDEKYTCCRLCSSYFLISGLTYSHKGISPQGRC